MCLAGDAAQRIQPLSFRRWQSGDVLEEASFGVAEPNSDQPTFDS